MLPSAGRQVTGLGADAAGESVSGLAGLILKTVTHTPAASLALASLPLLFERLPVRVLLVAVLASLALQTGRGPLLAPGALPLVLEFALAALAGLALDEQWRERRTRRGRRLRAYFLVASLASVGVLSIAAATLGGLPDRLAAAVGVYALALIAYFALADAEGEIAAGVFLLPLAVSFALQPTSREVFKTAPTRSQLVAGTPTRHAVDRALAELGKAPRVLTLVRSFPTDLALDLGFAGYGALAPRVQANGYDPMTPVSVRRAVGEMGARGFLTERSLTPPLSLLRNWAIDAVQVQANDLLRAPADEPFEVTIEPGTRRVFATPLLRLKSVALTFGEPPRAPLNVLVRVNGNREVPIGVVSAARTAVSSPSYRVDAAILEAPREGGAVRITSLGLETQEGPTALVSRLSAYLSQDAFQEIATTPQIRVFRVQGASSLVRGTAPVTLEVGPDPGGRLAFRTDTAQTVEVALPFLDGWSGGAVEFSGRIRVDARASSTRLSYTPAPVPARRRHGALRPPGRGLAPGQARPGDRFPQNQPGRGKIAVSPKELMPTPRPSVSVFFPAYNDAGTIASLVILAHMTVRGYTDDYEIIVVNDGSPGSHRRAPRRDGPGESLAEGGSPCREPGLRGRSPHGLSNRVEGARALHGRRRPV